jgi:hypothetical protein
VSVTYGNFLFSNVNTGSVTLHVPVGAKPAYEESAVWNVFKIVDDIVLKKDIVVMKDDVVVFRSAIADVDSIIFYNPVSPIVPSSSEALLIHHAANASVEETLLDDIRKLFFSDNKLSVETKCTAPLLYAIDDIEKLSFGGEEPSGINNVEQDRLNVVTYFTTEGDLVVESSEDIQSLTLFDINGRIIAIRNVPAGIYLVRVDTSQGTVVRKVVNNKKLNNR